MKVLDMDSIKNELYSKVDKFAIKIAPIYKELKWEWHDCGVPGVDNIKDSLCRLIDDLVAVDLTADSPAQHLSSGGLCVGYNVIIENGTIAFINMDMSFEVSADEYDSYEILNFMKDDV